MKPTKGISIFACIILMGSMFALLADSSQDILPLGPSKYKYLIDKIEKDQVIRTATGKVVTLEDIVNQNPDTDVFIIGEAHDNYQCHTFQRDFIETLYKKYPKIVVGFEFFRREDNEILEQWRTGQITEDEVIKKTGWYKRGAQDYSYTRLIMDILKKYRVKTIGLNVPRSILRTVSRKGFDQLSPEEKELFPTINIPNPEHEYFIKSIFGTFAAQVPMWFKNIYAAQRCWDVVMAESMHQTLAKKEFKGYKGIIIAGGNHVVYKLGIPFRYEKANKKAKITTIVPILMPEEKKEEEEEEEEPHPMMKMMGKSLNPAAIFSRGIADYVFAAHQPLHRHFPFIGFTVVEKNGKFIVTRVKKKSIAEKNGIRKDDQITAIDGVEITSLEQLRYLIAQKDWDDSITFGVVKKIEIKKE
ncbi:MAG: ChaN family lipoprotein [Candidatus Aminicenantes bacterium]|nr:MAG: ChaN family lipoprotein [Candidatus Aminicenantes bacterium]